MDDRDVLVGRRSEFRWRWFATRLHTFVVVFLTPALTHGVAEELTESARQYAMHHKGGLPRGFQTGTATIPVFLSAQVERGVEDWFTTQPKKGFAALRFPVLVDMTSDRLVYFKGRLTWGFVYAGHLRAVVTDVIEPSLHTRRNVGR